MATVSLEIIGRHVTDIGITASVDEADSSATKTQIELSLSTGDQATVLSHTQRSERNTALISIVFIVDWRPSVMTEVDSMKMKTLVCSPLGVMG